MIKLWIAGATVLGYIAILSVIQSLATAELAGIQSFYTDARTQAAAISASNR